MKQILKSMIAIIALFTVTIAIAAPRVLLMVVPGCRYCSEAENILDTSGVKYQKQISRQGAVPRLYVDGKYKGTGLEAIQSWVDQNKSR